LISYDLRDGGKRWWLNNLPRGDATPTPVYAEETLFITCPVRLTGDPVNPIELPNFDILIDRYDNDKDGRLVQSEIPDDFVSIYRLGPELAGVKRSFSKLDTDQDGAIGEAEWNKVVTETKNIKPRDMDSLIAISSGGKNDVSRTHVKWIVHEGVGQVPSPLFYRGRIYLVKHGGNVTCYNAKTGDKIYGDKLGPRTYYYASPVAADGKIYFCSLNGVVIVVEAGDKFKILAQNKIGERIYATAALVDGKIYLRTDKNMYAFGKAKNDYSRNSFTNN
jgi:outer membrane protein assembly factor BamB